MNIRIATKEESGLSASQIKTVHRSLERIYSRGYKGNSKKHDESALTPRRDQGLILKGLRTLAKSLA